LVILLVKLTTVVLHHRGRTDFSKAQTATVVGILKPDMLELVRFLLNFETNIQKLLQIVLFGQNELATNLESKKELKSRTGIPHPPMYN
jgi:type II secretory pathway predicted ATPase ExeA